MNLEELKEIWVSHAVDLSDKEYLNQQEIHTLLRERSKGAIHKVNRNMFYEWLASTVLFIGIVYWLFTRKEEVSSWEILLFLGIFQATGFFYYFKYKSLNRADAHSDNLMDYLETVTKSLGLYMRLYLYAVVFLVPILAFSGGYYGLYIRRLSLGTEESLLSFQGWFGFGMGMLIYSIIAIFSSNWYYKKLYGTHYKELKACLTELKEMS